jgi:crotonobetainyl-CoA:carnitine CoA-transferase CaiB-like acyl-CoA transferase
VIEMNYLNIKVEDEKKAMVTKEQVEAAKKEAGIAYQKYSLLKECFAKAEKEYFEKSQRFQALDHELALTDGRLIKLPSTASGKKVTKQPELTIDQLKTIAEKLGFSLNEVDSLEEEETGEEVDDEA